MTRDHPTVKIMVAYLVLIATLLYFDASHQVMAFDDIDRLDTVVSSSIVDNHRNTTEENRISNGHLAGKEVNYIVSIGVYYNESLGGHICAGALISTKSVVTAAHCVMDIGDVKPEIIVSVDSIGPIDSPLSTNLIIVKKKKVHDDFGINDAPVFDYDIAVLELDKSTEGTNAKPVNVKEKSKNSAYTDFKMYGWGKYSKEEEEYMGDGEFVSILRSLKMDIGESYSQDCRDNYQKNNIYIRLTDRLLCGERYKESTAIERPFKKDDSDIFWLTCGDNGAPVMDSRHLVAINIYSECRDIKFPAQGVYMRTDTKEIVEFLRKHMSGKTYSELKD